MPATAASDERRRLGRDLHDGAQQRLASLEDRVAAVGGPLTIESPPGEGTRLSAALPLPATVSSAAAPSAVACRC
jgi:signal transduction histidine kinase